MMRCSFGSVDRSISVALLNPWKLVQCTTFYVRSHLTLFLFHEIKTTAGYILSATRKFGINSAVLFFPALSNILGESENVGFEGIIISRENNVCKLAFSVIRFDKMLSEFREFSKIYQKRTRDYIGF